MPTIDYFQLLMLILECVIVGGLFLFLFRLRSISNAFKDGKTQQTTDEVFWRKDGASFPVEYTSTPIIEEGKAVGAVVVFEDFAKRKKLTNAIYELNASLEEKIKERTAALELNKKKLARMNKLFFGREVRMAELKNKIAALQKNKT